MSNKYNPWNKAKRFHILGYDISVVKGVREDERKFYTELHKDDEYLASMGSSMPLYWLAALETYLKRGRL